MNSIMSCIKSDLQATKIGLQMMWQDKTYFLFTLLMTTYFATLVGIIIVLLATIMPIIKPMAVAVGMKFLSQATFYILIITPLILNFMVAPFLPIMVLYYTFQSFVQKNVTFSQALALTLAKFKEHGPFTFWRQPGQVFFLSPIMALENLEWAAQVKRAHQLWITTSLANQVRWHYSKLFIFFPIYIVMFFIFMGGMIAGPIIFALVAALELFFICTLWIARLIFKTALYAYTQGQPTGLFSTSFVKKFFIQEHE